MKIPLVAALSVVAMALFAAPVAASVGGTEPQFTAPPGGGGGH